jgi:SAM-dependent methyltransferase
MQTGVYEAEAAVEADHWWFAGRRKLFASLISSLGLPKEAAILDIGTSTGTNLRLTRDLGFQNVVGLDASDEAVRFCAEKGLGVVKKGDACQLPFPANHFDFILASDIIEHVERDDLALAEICRALKPGCHALITVPAFRSLWGLHDEVSGHRRRYRMRPLLKKVGEAGLMVKYDFYFNYLLFFPIWAARRAMRALGVQFQSEAEVNSQLMNRIFTPLFRLDVATAPYLRPPFGVSALVLARKRPSQ